MRFCVFVFRLILTITAVNCFNLNSLYSGSNEDISPVIYVSDEGDQRVIFIVSKIAQWIQNTDNVKQYDTQSTMTIETRFGGEESPTKNERNADKDNQHNISKELEGDDNIGEKNYTETGTKKKDENTDNKTENEVTGDNLENGAKEKEEDDTDIENEENDDNSEGDTDADNGEGEDEKHGYDDVIVDFEDAGVSSNNMQIQIMKNILANQHNLALKQNRRRSVVPQQQQKEEIMSYNLYRNVKQRGETKRKRVRVVVNKQIF